jgi:hypothetical protein
MSMPLDLYSADRLNEKWVTNDFVDPYRDRRGVHSGVPAVEEMLTMAPLPRASMLGSTACVAFTTDAQLMATRLSIVSAVSS